MSETFGDIRQFQLDSISIGEHAYAGALRFFAREITQEPMSEEIIKAPISALHFSRYS